MNPHFNLFRAYSNSSEVDFLENNLSRAFALCLANDTLFFSHYIQSIVSAEDFEYLFSVYASDSQYTVDLQQDMNNVDIDALRRVYAVAMTTEQLTMNDFLDQTTLPDRDRHVTDVWIQVKDIALVIEVKRNAADCKQQLYNQILPFVNAKTTIPVTPVSFPWPSVINLMERTITLQKIMYRPNIFLTDFLHLSDTRFPEWSPSRPFSMLPFSADPSTATYKQLTKRLRQCIGGSGYPFGTSGRRLSIGVPFGWASEIQPDFARVENSNYLILYIWPGNTKGQGHPIYSHSMDWVDNDQLLVDDRHYELEFAFNVKFCHFNGYVTGFNFADGNLRGERIHTRENFYNYSGKWYREDWPSLEVFLDEHLTAEFDWRGKSQWDQHFPDSDRSYLTVSFGFEITLWIPFSEFTGIDQQAANVTPAGALLAKFIDALKTLIPA